MCVDNEYTIYYLDSLPGAVYTWNITNGTLLSGQGTASIRVETANPSSVWGLYSSTGNPGLGVTINIIDPLAGPIMVESCQFEVFESIPYFTTNGYPQIVCDTTQRYYFSTVKEGFTVPTPSFWNFFELIGFRGDSIVYEMDVPSSSDETIHVWGTFGKGGIGFAGVWGEHTYAGCGELIGDPVNLFPNPNIQGLDGACAGDTLNYYTHPNAGKTWTWEVQGGHFASPPIQNTATVVWDSLGTQLVRVQEHNGGCGVWDTLFVNIDTTFAISLPSDTLCPFQSYYLTAPPGMATYAWSNGDTTPNWIAPDSGNYWLTVTTTGGCVASDSFNITYLPGDKVSLGPDTFRCTPGFITVHATPNHPGSSFLWNTGVYWQVRPDSLNASHPGPKIVQMTDSLGCKSKDTINLYFPPDPGLANTYQSCSPGADTISVWAGAASYLWSNGDTTHWTVPASPGTYSVQILDAYGCTTYDTALFSTGAVLPPFSLGNDTVLCDLNYGLAGPPGYSNYEWFLNDTLIPWYNYDSLPLIKGGTYRLKISNAFCEREDTINVIVSRLANNILNNSYSFCGISASYLNGFSGMSHTWSTGDTTSSIHVTTGGTYWVQISDTLGCSASDTTAVTIKPVPSIFLGNDTILCNAASFTLDAGPGFSQYRWSNLNTSWYGGQTQTVTSSGPKVGMVRGSNGCWGRDTINLTFSDLRDLDLDSAYAICSATGDSVSVNLPGMQYVWSTGDTTEYIIPTSSGTYSVIVSDTLGCVGYDTAQVSIGSLVSFNLGPDTLVCQDTFLLAGPTGGYIYTWSRNGSVAPGTDSIFPVVTSGNYSLELDNSGCSTFDTIAVTLSPAVFANLGADQAFCDGITANLTPGSGFDQYNWSTGDTLSSVTVGSSGYYWVDVTDSNGCVYRDSVTITVHPLPAVFLGNDTILCNAASFTLDAGGGYSFYQWSDFSSTWWGNRYNSFSTSGPKSVRVRDGNLCWGRDTINLTFSEIRNASLDSNYAICPAYNDSISVNVGGLQYLWSTGDTTQSIAPTVGGTYYVMFSDTLGCVGQDSAQVTLGTPVPFSLGPDTIVCNDTLWLDAPSGGTNYSWKRGSSTLPGTGASIPVTANGTYSLALNNAGCITRDTIIVQFSPAVSVNLGADQEFCEGITANLSTGVTGQQYLWSSGDTVATITVDTSGIYWVEVTDSLGCSARDSIEITVNPVPSINLGPDTIFVCSFPYTISLTPGYFQYYWSNFSNVWPGSATQTFTGPGRKHVAVRSTNNCWARDTVTLLQAPLLAPVLHDTSYCPGQSINVSAAAGAVSYLWSNGDTTQNVQLGDSGAYYVDVTSTFGCTHRDSLTLSPIIPDPLADAYYICGSDSLFASVNPGYAAYLWSSGSSTFADTITFPGSNWVTITDSTGCVVTDSFSVINFPNLSISLGNDTIVCDGNPIQISPGPGFPNYYWSTGASSPTITPGISGIYSVEVADSFGCNAIDSVEIVYSNVNSLSLPDTFSFCNTSPQPLSVNLAGLDYIWSSGDSTQSIIPTISGDYFVTVTDSYGCSASDTSAVFIGTMVSFSLGPDTMVCNSYLMQVNGLVAGYNLIWRRNGIPVQTGGSAYLATTSGAYSLEIENNSCYSYDTIQVSISPGPIIQPLGPDTSYCPNASITLDPDSNVTSYTWNTGVQNTPITITQPGSYSISGTTSFGCPVSDTVVVDTLPGAYPDLGPDTTHCQGTPLILTPGFNYQSWNWSNGSTIREIRPNQSGTYSVTVTNAFGCSESDAVNVTIYPLPDPDFSWLLTAPMSNVYEFTQLTSTPQDSFYWDFGDGTVSTDSNPTHSFPGTNMYTICLYSMNPCGIRSYCENIQAFVGAQEPESGNSITLLPNPASTEIRLKSEKIFSRETPVRIFNGLGQLVYSGKWQVGERELRIGLDGFSEGEYLVVISDQERIWSKKFLIIR